MLIKIRLKYEKGDEIKYISHLDMLKLFERASRRCELPIAYTEGFNPRPRLVFGNPLPVGVTSESEFVDIYLTEDMKPEELRDKLNEVMPKGARIIEGRVLGDREDNIMKSVTKSEYVVKVMIEDEDAKKIISVYNSNVPLKIIKRSKSGNKETDVRPMIHHLEIDGDELLIITDAGNTSNLRPDLAIEALKEHANVNVTIKSVHRSKLL